MSLQEALRFFRSVESEPAVRDAVGSLAPDSGLVGLEQTAREHGFDVTMDELRDAFVHDAGLRKVFYSRSSQE